jgi:cytochrome c-type biogenesis protein CcmH
MESHPSNGNRTFGGVHADTCVDGRLRGHDGGKQVAGKLLFACVAIFMACGVALAVDPDEIMQDPALEARARALSAGLRCLVCQNQSIDDSNAPLARDLRLLVRERLKAGDSDAQVMQFVEDRYGEFVLLRPPLSWRTVVLWGSPILALIVAVWMTAQAWRRRQLPAGASGGAAAPLSADEEEKLRAILAENEGEPPGRD